MRAAMLRQPAHLVSGWIAGGCGLACRTAPEKLRAPPPSSTLCTRRKAGRGTDGEGLERRSLHWPRRTSVRGTWLRPPPRRCSPRDGYQPGAFEKVLRLLDPLREIVGDPVLSGCRAPGRWRRRRPERLLRRPKGFEEKVDPVHRFRVGDGLLVPVSFPGHAQLKPLQGGLVSGRLRSRSRTGFSPARSSPASAADCRPEVRRGR